MSLTCFSYIELDGLCTEGARVRSRSLSLSATRDGMEIQHGVVLWASATSWPHQNSGKSSDVFKKDNDNYTFPPQKFMKFGVNNHRDLLYPIRWLSTIRVNQGHNQGVVKTEFSNILPVINVDY